MQHECDRHRNPYKMLECLKEDYSLRGRTMLRRNLRKQYLRMWTGFRPTERVSASRKGPYTMQIRSSFPKRSLSVHINYERIPVFVCVECIQGYNLSYSWLSWKRTIHDVTVIFMRMYMLFYPSHGAVNLYTVCVVFVVSAGKWLFKRK